MVKQKFNNDKPKQWYIIQKSPFKPPTYFYCNKNLHSKQKHVPLIFGTYKQAQQAYRKIKEEWKSKAPESIKHPVKYKPTTNPKPHKSQEILIAVDIRSKPKHHKSKQYKSIISRTQSKPISQYGPVPSNESEYMQELQRKFEENLKKMK